MIIKRIYKNNKINFDGFSGSNLKWIAIISMLIDHIAASEILFKIENYLFKGTHSLTIYEMKQSYWIFRYLGRIALPIFCFFLVEGFFNTKNLKKYIARIFIFAVVSEIPFDIAFNFKIVDFKCQNVLFTMFLGLLMMTSLVEISKRVENVLESNILQVSVIIIFAIISIFTRVDYDYCGIGVIVAFYYLKNVKYIREIVVIIIMITYSQIEIVGLVALGLILLYNGKRGKQNKYFFYAFYPMHLVVLALARKLL